MSIKNVSVNKIFVTICLQRTERDHFKYRERSGRILKSPENGWVVCCNPKVSSRYILCTTYKDFSQLLSLLPAPPPTIPSKNPGENTAVNRSTRFDCASTVIPENFAGKIFSEVGSIQKLNVPKHIAYRKNTETKKKSYSNNTPTEKIILCCKM